jgi:hypothetical protein
MKKAVGVVMCMLIGLTQIGFAQTQTPTSAANDKEDLLRTLRFGNRELNLPLRLQNDELGLKNHGLDNDIAQLQGRPEDKDLARIAVDRFLIEQDKAAITVANSFAQVWSTGDHELQRKLFDAEKQFDEADKNCHPGSNRASEESSVPAATLEEAEANCARFHSIYLMVSRYQITVSVPPPSIFKHSNTLNSTGEKLLQADNLQLKRDMAAHRPARLILGDQMVIGLDKQLWLQEISHTNTVEYNNKHPQEQMANDLDIVKLVTDIRRRVLDIQNELRRQLLTTKR